MSNNETGRHKIVFNDEQIAKVEDLARNLTIQQIADYFGICERTFREIRDRDFAVFTAYKKGKAKSIEHVASKLMENINKNDTTSIIFYLKTQAGWSEKQDLNVTTKNVTPKPMKVVVNFSKPPEIANLSADEVDKNLD
jgi:hypothetical protein